MKHTKADKVQQQTAHTAAPAAGKKSWQDPKLVFVEPKLTKHGAVKDLTGGFFGTFAP